MKIRKTVRTNEMIVEKTETLTISRRATRSVPADFSDDADGDRPKTISIEPEADVHDQADNDESFAP